MKSLRELRFDNTYARLPAGFHSRVNPAPLAGAHMVSVSPAAAGLLDLAVEGLHGPEALAWLGGEQPLPGGDPVAMCYAGHQFGHFVPQLGDGDGRAVLRSSIREYLCSEAMHAQGIPTTRALCLLGSDEEVYRERIERGALLVRMAPSHVRFGSFEVFFHRGQYDQLRQLADYVIGHDYPHLSGQARPYAALLGEVVSRTARLLAQWQLVGFSHGVMNTDNMSILGLTLDYGPFGFLDAYEPGFICNHSDHRRRYALDRPVEPELPGPGDAATVRCRRRRGGRRRGPGVAGRIRAGARTGLCRGYARQAGPAR
jgi:hypothetical protein